MMHGSEGIIRLALLRRAVRGRRRHAVAVRARARAPAVRRDRARAARPARLADSPDPIAPYSELSSALSLLLLGSVLAQVLSYAQLPRRATSSPTRAEKASRRQVHHRTLHRAHPDPVVPGRAGRAAPEAGGPRRRGSPRRLPRRHAQARADRDRPRVARHRRGGDDRSVRRRAPVRQGQVHPRPPRPRAARRGQRLLHPGPDPRAGSDRAARLRRGSDLLDGRDRRVRRRSRPSSTTSSCASSSGSSPAPRSASVAMGVALLAAHAPRHRRPTVSRSSSRTFRTNRSRSERVAGFGDSPVSWKRIAETRSPVPSPDDAAGTYARHQSTPALRCCGSRGPKQWVKNVLVFAAPGPPACSPSRGRARTRPSRSSASASPRAAPTS